MPELSHSSFDPPPPGTVDVMIDLETLSTRPDAAIVSIGACWFNANTGDVGRPIHILIDMADSIRSGGHVDGDTVRWWLQQSDQARQAITQGCRSTMEDALGMLHTYLRGVASFDEVRVWGNGADFDLPILASAFAREHYDQPWRYYNGRCLRTLRKLHPEVDEPTFEGTPHNAAHDARHQALHAIAILRVIAAKKSVELTMLQFGRLVDHLVDRVIKDGRLAWLIGPGSETFDRLCAAAVWGTSVSPSQYALQLGAQIKPLRVVVDESEG